MAEPIILLHEKCLCPPSVANSWIRSAGDAQSRADIRCVHIWDDDYYRRRNYSLKRLVFIYECLQDLQITTYRGDTLEVLAQLNPDMLYVPRSADSVIRALTARVEDRFTVQTIHAPGIADVPETLEAKRFFKFWDHAKKSAMVPSCGGRQFD